MITVMTHMDADGIISLTLFLKKIGGAKIRAYFTSPVQLRDTICHSVINKRSLGELYIFDIAGENRAIFAAAIYDRVVWMDHHDWEPDATISHVKIIIDKNARSAAHVVAWYFDIDSPLVELANQIDTNSVESEEAEKIRLIIGALRWKYSGFELNKNLYRFSRELMNEDFSILSTYDDIVSQYKDWIEKVKIRVGKETKYFKVKNMKIAIFETMESVPVYLVGNEIPDDVDILVVMLHHSTPRTNITKLEFRTHTDKDVLKIAKFYGGGGHKKASGASVGDIVTIPEVLKAVELLYE